jgi:hypothetical protein
MGIYRAKFTEEQKASMRQLREVFGLTWEQVGKRFGVGAKTAHAAIDPEYNKKYRAQLVEQGVRRKERGYKPIDDDRIRSVSIPQSVVDERERRLSAGFRSIADQVLGCPPIGFSALDRRNGVGA